jgi:chromosome partitioning protein
MAIVVAFVSQKGGVGKSTLARALAAVAAHGGLKVLLADLDPQQQTVMRWHDARTKRKVGPTLDARGFSSIHDALAAGADSDLIVIDTPGRANRATRDIARHAHLTVVPTAGTLDDLHPSVLLLHELVQVGIAREGLAVALCRILSEGEEAAARAYVAEADYEVLPGSIPERPAYRDAHNSGRALTETRNPTLNARADALMEGLLVKIGSLIAGTVTPNAERENASKGSR